MNTEQAVELRKRLELDVLALLQAYRRATGMTPTRVEVHHADVFVTGGDPSRSIALTGVSVTVEL